MPSKAIRRAAKQYCLAPNALRCLGCDADVQTFPLPSSDSIGTGGQNPASDRKKAVTGRHGLAAGVKCACLIISTAAVVPYMPYIYQSDRRPSLGAELLTRLLATTTRFPSSCIRTYGVFTRSSKRPANFQQRYSKLEIWGKTQRESARRPKSDWRRNFEG